MAHALRNAMHDRLEAGQPFDHYRATWLRASVVEVIRLLDAIAHDFNCEHEDDRCTSDDLLDVLSSALATIRAAGGSESS